jgi:prevent-host-death family protein
MSKQYSIAQARDKLASIIHAVENGDSVEITRGGKRVAVLVSSDEYDRLTAGKLSLWQALERFRQEVDLASLRIEPETFEGADPEIRAPSTARTTG